MYKISLNRQKKTKINHINDNHIKFDVSLHFGGIWPIVRRRDVGGRAVGNVNSKRMWIVDRQCKILDNNDKFFYTVCRI